jgi:hypothetical protein
MGGTCVAAVWTRRRCFFPTRLSAGAAGNALSSGGAGEVTWPLSTSYSVVRQCASTPAYSSCAALSGRPPQSEHCSATRGYSTHVNCG